MDTINWAQLGLAAVLGLVIGCAVMAAGMFMDRTRDRRWNRELNDKGQSGE